MAGDTDEAIEKMRAAAPFSDVIEIRLDVMRAFDLDTIIPAASNPLIVTYRSKKEGGNGLAHYETRLRHLMKAIASGADFVDVEYRMPLAFRQPLLQMQRSSKLIMSIHISNGTPSREILYDLLRKMAATGADILKIITLARNPEDNLRVLGLIPIARKLGIPIIAFCMGPLGRISRIATCHVGGFLTFASLDDDQASAPGQLTIREMRKIFEMLSS
jgi:3-dehydroquinate dehydratase-1